MVCLAALTKLELAAYKRKEIWDSCILCQTREFTVQIYRFQKPALVKLSSYTLLSITVSLNLKTITEAGQLLQDGWLL